MKKILALALCLALAVSVFAGCGNKKDDSQSQGNSQSQSEEVKNLEGTLGEIMDKIYADVPEDIMPMTDNSPIAEDMSEFMLGITADRYKEAQSGDAMINAVAHSVVLVRANSVDDVEKLKEDIKANANPRKWVCTEAEKIVVDSIGDVVILIMSSEETADAVHANFKALAE